jgi:hypothetical protein
LKEEFCIWRTQLLQSSIPALVGSVVESSVDVERQSNLLGALIRGLEKVEM